MNSNIADKLQYLADTKTIIKEAIETKGQEIPDDAAFRDFAQYILLIADGGGGGTIHLYADETIWPNDTSFRMLSDVYLAEDMSVDNLDISTDNIERVERLDDLHFEVYLKNPLAVGEKISVIAQPELYYFQNGESLEFTKYVTEPPLVDFLNETRHMKMLRNNAYNDEGSDTYVCEENGKSYLLHGNSYANENGTTTIWVNNRDASSYYTYGSYAKLYNCTFVKLRWQGCSHYNNGLQELIWEAFIFDNGDYMLNFIGLPNTRGGTCKIRDQVFTIPESIPDDEKEKGYPMAFYRNDWYTDRTYDIVHEVYDPSKNWRISNWLCHTGTLESFLGVYDFPDDHSFHTFYKNGRCDGGLGTYTFPTSTCFTFPLTSTTNASSIYVHGDCYIEINGNMIALNKRDGSVNNFYAQWCRLSDYNNLQAIRWIWSGNPNYSLSTPDHIFEVWMFENGDIMIYLHQKTINYINNTYSFFGKSFSLNEGECLSCYHDLENDTWELKNEIYRASE